MVLEFIRGWLMATYEDTDDNKLIAYDGEKLSYCKIQGAELVTDNEEVSEKCDSLLDWVKESNGEVKVNGEKYYLNGMFPMPGMNYLFFSKNDYSFFDFYKPVWDTVNFDMSLQKKDELEWDDVYNAFTEGFLHLEGGVFCFVEDGKYSMFGLVISFDDLDNNEGDYFLSLWYDEKLYNRNSAREKIKNNLKKCDVYCKNE